MALRRRWPEDPCLNEWPRLERRSERRPAGRAAGSRTPCPALHPDADDEGRHQSAGHQCEEDQRRRDRCNGAKTTPATAPVPRLAQTNSAGRSGSHRERASARSCATAGAAWSAPVGRGGTSSSKGRRAACPRLERRRCRSPSARRYDAQAWPSRAERAQKSSTAARARRGQTDARSRSATCRASNRRSSEAATTPASGRRGGANAASETFTVLSASRASRVAWRAGRGWSPGRAVVS